MSPEVQVAVRLTGFLFVVGPNQTGNLRNSANVWPQELISDPTKINVHA